MRSRGYAHPMFCPDVDFSPCFNYILGDAYKIKNPVKKKKRREKINKNIEMANDFPKKREGCNNEKESVGLRVSRLS